MVNEAYEAQDYPRIITLVDSLKTLGTLSEGQADYWLGYAYDRLMQKRMAELYWKKGIAAVENSNEVEDVKVYAAIIQQLPRYHRGSEVRHRPIPRWCRAERRSHHSGRPCAI